jgi:CubicO group peptidase (beta-lactamase class C family)
MSDSTRAIPAGNEAADDGGEPRRRSFLKLGGVTLLAGGVAASTAAAARPAAASTATAGTAAAPPRDTAGPADVVLTADSSVPPDLQSLVPIPSTRIPAAVAKLDSIIEDVMARTGVPGLAAAVVHNDRVLYAQGFGVRDVNSPARVNASTVFHLASVSKPLSSTVVAGVVGKKTIAWTDPVVAHLPAFALADPYVTEHVTYADLFSHTSGLPDHAGDLLEDLGYGQS